jgi:xanthine dehydrogenase YagS FAD-binding subunit
VKPFRYERPGSAADATALAEREPDLAYLAGGTNLVDLMRLEVASPPVLVDVHDLGLDAIHDTPGGGLLIGSAATNSAVAADARVRERYPVLRQALLNGASPQLRNRATVGGNLLQRTRCAYFQDVTKPCNKRDPGSGCPAIEGEHRNLAILDWSPHCVATHPSDMAVALAALDASVHIRTNEGVAICSLADLYRLPEDEPERDTTLEHGQLITAIEVPPAPARSSYRKVRDRASFSFAVVSVAAALELRRGVIRDVRIALGGVAHIPWRAHAAEAELRGAAPTEDAFDRAAEAELLAARPLERNGFKVELARKVIVRSLAELTV